MRRFLFSAVIASVTAAMPAWAIGSDREIAQAIMTELQTQKSEGILRGFDIDLRVDKGVVYLNGTVGSPAQRALVARAASNVDGIEELVNNLVVEESEIELAHAKGNSQRNSAGPSRVVPASASQANAQPSASDVAITDRIIGRLQKEKQAGLLRGFELDVSTVNGDVWLRGKVANDDQKDRVLGLVRRTSGVRRVVDDIGVANSKSGGAVRPASGNGPAPLTLDGSPKVSSMPVMGGAPVPRPFAPSGVASYVQGEGVAGVAGTPMPMQGAGSSYGGGAPRYDQPYMPSYAWPSYAAYPNYAAVTYPKQYSPSAWPYIGPFYPYPQVPLGWRKVALEWDDGLWYLDFTSK